MIDAVLFDLGDTIINFGQLDQEGLFRLGSRHTYDFLLRHKHALPAYEIYHKTHHRAIKRAYLLSKLKRREFNCMDVVARVLKKMDIVLAEPEFRELAWLWYAPCRKAGHVEPGTHAMLHSLRDAGLKLTIVSNTFIPGHCLDRHLRDENLLEFFPVRIYSSDVRFQKPHPTIFRLALQQTHVPANRAVFIGDLLKADIRGGRRAGMKTVWKPAIHHESPHTTAHKADARITTILDLPDTLRTLGWRPRTPAMA